jgi:pimeloyl-ACP methyl ester carboxylesterase
MTAHRIVISLLIILAITLPVLSLHTPSSSSLTDCTPQKKTFTQPLDHFTYGWSNKTYTQHFWECPRPTATKPLPNEGKPLMWLYIGGEAGLDYYWHNSGGYFREMCIRSGGYCVFLEHRFYGSSFPTVDNTNSYTHSPYLSDTPDVLVKYGRYLNIEQALADAARFITTIAPNYRVIVGGGSYAGQLAAYARIRYPHLVHAAIASSAPFQMMGYNWEKGLKMNYEYFRKVTRSFDNIDNRIPGIVRSGYVQLVSLFDRKQFNQIETMLNLSTTITTSADLEYVKLWIRQAFTNLSQGNHPRDTLEDSYPAIHAVKAMLDTDWQRNPIKAIGVAMDVAYGNQPHDIYEEFVFCVDESGCGNEIDGHSWDIQACYQEVYYPSTNNSTDMFPPREHTIFTHEEYCQRVYGVKPNTRYLQREFPNEDHTWLSTPQNIIFTTGLLDPWCSGSVQRSLTPRLPVINIPNASHHLDLNTQTKNDPDVIKVVRSYIYDILIEMASENSREDYLKEYQLKIDREFPMDCYSDA